MSDFYVIEKKFQSSILKWLNDLNLYAIKQNASGITKVGVPDIIVNIRGLFVGIEVKREEGTATELQKYTVGEINNGEGIALILRPSMYHEFKQIIMTFIKKKRINIKDITDFKVKLRNLSLV